jgi:hypothetical protein
MAATTEEQDFVRHLIRMCTTWVRSFREEGCMHQLIKLL